MDTLFDWEARHARTSDPITSHQAAAQAQSMAQIHARKILKFLQAIYPKGTTYDVIAEATKLDRHAVGRRLPELLEAGRAYPTGEYRMMGTGRKGRVWAATNGD